MTTRRAFLSTLASGLLAAPLAAEAQQAGKVRRIGTLDTGALPTPTELAQSPILQELTKLGWIEGQNLVIERRRANSVAELEPLATDLVRLKVEIIIVPSESLLRIAQKATRTMPIVVTNAGDLVSSGVVASLSKPGGNVTGMQIIAPELMGKRLRMVVLGTPGHFSGYFRQGIDEAARKLVIRVRYVTLKPDELSAFFDEIARERDQALLVLASPFTSPYRRAIAEQALRRRVPTMSDMRVYEDCLLVYGPVMDDVLRGRAPRAARGPRWPPPGGAGARGLPDRGRPPDLNQVAPNGGIMPAKVPSNRGERTVLTYVKLEFRGDWEYNFGDYSFRPVKETAELLVVTEAPTGSLVTYWFLVRRRPDPAPSSYLLTDHVIAPREENIVYIPERCRKRARGDQTQVRK